MSRFIAVNRIIELPNKIAFNFLSRGHNAAINMTSAIPISPAPERILKSYTIETSEYKPDFSYLARGMSRGENFALEAVANYFRSKGIKCNASNVSFNYGIIPTISKIYQILGLNRQGKVLVPTPTFGYYFQQLADNEIEFQALSTRKENGFLIDPENLEKTLKSNQEIKALILCYPNNPTGVVMTEQNARDIAFLCKKYEIFVISDEIFINNPLSDRKHFSIAATSPEMLEQSITLTSPSKSMGFPALRLAICAGSSEIIERFSILGGYPVIDQRMITSAIENNEENSKYLEENRQKYLSNINFVKTKISSLNEKLQEQFDEKRDFVKPFIENPEAGNVYLIDFSGLRGKIYQDKPLESGLDIAEFILEEASVATVPGECSMFEGSEMLIRIALGHTQHEIEKAFDNIETSLVKIKNIGKSPESSNASSIKEKDSITLG